MNEPRTKQWPQYLAAITATISLLVAGSHIGWTSPTLPRLKSPESPLPITSNDASWIASFYLLGSIPGNFIAALMVDRIGRKNSLLISAIPLLLGWILILVAWNEYVLYASRLISGLGQGVVYVVCPMYIGEIADKKIRGSLGSLIKLMVTLGELYGHAVGPFVSYECLAYISAIIPIIFFLTFIWMPESPYYLLMRDRQEEAKKSLSQLRRYKSKSDLREEMDQTQKAVAKDLRDKGRFLDLINVLGNRRAVFISFGLQLILQFSGIAAIESYTQEILGYSDSGLSPGIAVIILSVLQFIAGLGATALVDRLGRRPLLLVTTLLGGVSLAIAGLFCFLELYLEFDMDGLGWILDTSVIFYELIIALGLNPLSYMMLGELFPTNVKGVAVSLTNVWSSLLAFMVSKMYQVVTDSCGIYASFAWFSSTCFFGVVFIFFVVPETKGRSLMEIQESLNCRKNGKEEEEGEEEEAKRKKENDMELKISTIS